MHRIPAVENTQEIKAFFNHWNIYHKVMEHNYMAHRRVYGVLRRLLVKHFSGKPFTLLDLGCGDAEFMSRALAGTRIRAYTGVDISEVALTLARKNMRRLGCRKKFIRGDFFREIRRRPRADVVWLSLAFHHLRLGQKAEFFKRCGKICAPGGFVIFYEPVLRAGKPRDDFLKRWWRFVARHWQALTKRELRLVKKHIVDNDFPESFSTYACLARRAGFCRAQQLFSDRAGVNKIMVFARRAATASSSLRPGTRPPRRSARAAAGARPRVFPAG